MNLKTRTMGLILVSGLALAASGSFAASDAPDEMKKMDDSMQKMEGEMKDGMKKMDDDMKADGMQKMDDNMEKMKDDGMQKMDAKKMDDMPAS